MSTQDERIVRIEHEDGRRYAVSEATYKNTKMPALDDTTYQDAGFKIVSFEDGTPYEEGAEPTALALNAEALMPEIGEEPQQPHARRSRASASASASEAEPKAAE